MGGGTQERKRKRLKKSEARNIEILISQFPFPFVTSIYPFPFISPSRLLYVHTISQRDRNQTKIDRYIDEIDESERCTRVALCILY